MADIKLNLTGNKAMLHIIAAPLEIKTNRLTDDNTVIRVGPANSWRSCAVITDMANEDPEYAHEEAQAYAALFSIAPRMASALKDILKEYSEEGRVGPIAMQLAYNLLQSININPNDRSNAFGR